MPCEVQERLTGGAERRQQGVPCNDMFCGSPFDRPTFQPRSSTLFWYENADRRQISGERLDHYCRANEAYSLKEDFMSDFIALNRPMQSEMAHVMGSCF